MKILIAISFLFLVACKTTPKVDIVTTPIERAKLTLQDPDPVTMEDIEWIIITEENFQEVIEDLESRGINIAIFGLTDEDYEDLSVNFARLRAYIESQKAVISSYRDYYENE
jgi:predicted Zn-dependent protease